MEIYYYYFKKYQAVTKVAKVNSKEKITKTKIQ